MTMKVPQNLKLMQKMLVQWNQQIFRYIFSKVNKCLEKSNTRINTECAKTNRLQKKTNTEQMNSVQNIWMKVWKHKAVGCLEIHRSKADACSFCFCLFVLS